MTPSALKRLREWFKKNAAQLPWRPLDLDAPRDPYAVWISETMLQQTQVATVKNYFVRWMERFPDIVTLAKAQEPEVFKYWQGLGYYSRAKNILKTAKILSEAATKSSKVAKTMPENRKDLEALPGIGAYTAGAILSLAYHQKEAILDGNLVRIFSRFYTLDFLPTDKFKDKAVNQTTSQIYWGYAKNVTQNSKAYLHNEALMELGRTTCKIKNPECERCPLNLECKAFIENRTHQFPPSKKQQQKDWHGTVLVIETLDHQILAVLGGQKFFKNQFALPHFESPNNAPQGLNPQAEAYVNADQVLCLTPCGHFKHSITIHKMDCQVLHIQLNINATDSPNVGPHLQWVPRTHTAEFFANNFSLKALALAKIHHI